MDSEFTSTKPLAIISSEGFKRLNTITQRYVQLFPPNYLKRLEDGYQKQFHIPNRLNIWNLGAASNGKTNNFPTAEAHYKDMGLCSMGVRKLLFEESRSRINAHS